MSGFNINYDKIKEIYKNTVDEMLETDLFSSEVILYYPPTLSECTDCVGSFNCLACGGKGIVETSNTETIRLRIHISSGRSSFNKNMYKKMGLDNIQYAEGDIFVLGNMSNINKVKSANHFSIYDSLALSNFKYILKTEPLPYGLCRDLYFYAFLKREDHI